MSRVVTWRISVIRAGATVDISGGNIDNLDGSSANHLTIRGGSFGDNFDIGSTADANIQGQNFELDGVPIAGLDTPGNQVTFNLASNRLFTGTLADGTPFAFRTNEGDAIGSVKLVRSADVAAGPAVINVSTTSTQLGVPQGQTLNLLSGGSLPRTLTPAGVASSMFRADRSAKTWRTIRQPP